ncbi:MAG TPA: PQQ-dependent sugar dehydrogenase [Dehalococcoidia bacterium]|nr:PQQ-dependent sugar dehydrogenase [Dehalococcoidia bacterium]
MRWLALAVAVVILGACSNNGSSATPSPRASSAAPGSASPNASPAAQTTTTPASSTPQPPATPPKPDAYTATKLLESSELNQATSAVPEPGASTVLVLAKRGVIDRLDLAKPGTAPSLFMDITGRLIPNPGLEEGLLGIALAPDYATSGNFYLYYSAGGPRRAVLSRFHASSGKGDPNSEQVLLEIPEPFANHNGGQLAFGPDGDLYIGVGDGGSEGDPQRNGQNTHTLLGKILRIDVSGSGPKYAVPADNPFAHGDGSPEIYATGFRNPWRFSFDTKTGQLWAGDVGQDKYEEVDHVELGKNYGWSIMEASHCYNPSSGCDMGGLTLPRAEYSHSEGCSITGGYVYRGAAMPELEGWFVYSDFCSGRIWAFDTADATSEPVGLANTGLSVSSLLQGNDGELYLVGFSGALYKIGRK